MQRTPSAALALGVALLVLLPARGSSVLPLSLVELCERATTIQRVRVLSAEAEQGERLERPALVTRLRFEVLDVLAGELLLFLHNQETQSPYLGLWQGVYRLRPKGTYREGRALLDVTRAGELAFVRDNEPALEVEVFLDEVRRLLAELEARGEAEAGS